MPQRILCGRVVSQECDKTAVIEVTQVTRHRLYNKNIVRSQKYLVHDADNRCQPGMWVRIRESRPLSKKKKWVVLGLGSPENQDFGDIAKGE